MQVDKTLPVVVGGGEVLNFAHFVNLPCPIMFDVHFFLLHFYVNFLADPLMTHILKNNNMVLLGYYVNFYYLNCLYGSEMRCDHPQILHLISLSSNPPILFLLAPLVSTSAS